MNNRIRELRKTRGITMKQLGEVLGLAESTISQYENGKRQPDYETLLRLGEYFGVSVGYILGIEEKTPLVHGDEELNELLETLKTRPECRMLFQLSKDATKEEVEKAIRIIEALRET